MYCLITFLCVLFAKARPESANADRRLHHHHHRRRIAHTRPTETQTVLIHNHASNNKLSPAIQS